jgi:hypothetical protein
MVSFFSCLAEDYSTEKHNHAGVVASQHLQTDWPVHRIIEESQTDLPRYLPLFLIVTTGTILIMKMNPLFFVR